MKKYINIIRNYWVKETPFYMAELHISLWNFGEHF